MRKTTTLFAVLLGSFTYAQVTMDVLSPTDLAGAYAHTWADPDPPAGWATPDMTLVENRVIGELALAVDATTDMDSLCCEAVINSSTVSGKVALIYRGECNYSLKALNCQNAGAIAVLIINNVPGAPAEMGSGTTGPQVTIPVFQISDVDGALIRAGMADGPVTVLLGNKNGYYAADLGFNKLGILLPPSMSMPTWLAANPGEYSVRIGAYVHNFGTELQTGAVLSATVLNGSTSLYSEVSDPLAIQPGDSAFIELPPLDQASWSGNYTLTYNTLFDGTEQHSPDNSFTVNFASDSIYAAVPRDAVTGIPITTIGIQPSPASTSYETCLHFRNDNGSRTAVDGIHFYASIQDPGDLEDELMISHVYQWEDAFDVVSDPGFAFASLLQIHSQEHFIADTGNFVTTYVAFDEPVVLEDGLRYLICVNTLNTGVFFGHNEDINYSTHEEIYDQPVDPHQGDTGWFLGFVGGAVSSLGIQMIDASTIGIRENGTTELNASPNPSVGVFRIGLEGHGSTVMSLTDASGRVLDTYRTNNAQYVLDLRGEAPGMYLLSIQSEKGRAVARLILE